MLYFSDNELHRLDVAYGIASIKNNDCNVITHQVHNDNFDKVINSIIIEKPTIIVIFLSYGCFDLLEKSCLVMKDKNPNSIIIVCHSFASRCYKKLLSEISQIDVAVLGEYEESLNELCKLFFSGNDIGDCKGIAYIKNSQIQINNHRPLADINKIPLPNRDFDYQNSNFFHVYGSRGCEGHCTFCDRNNLYSIGNTYCVRLRSIENIVEEIDLLVERYNCKFVSFSDPTFISSTETISRLDKLYDLLSQKYYWVQFTFNIRAEQINEDIFQCLIKLKKCGLGKIFIGIESFNEKDLKLFGKRAGVYAVKKCIDILKNIEELNDDYCIKVEYGFINFNPYSTRVSLQHNIQTFKNMKLNLNPYIISSKLTVNALTPISIKIDNDNLFSFHLDSLALRDAMQYGFEYRFMEADVERIHMAVKKICETISIHNDNGLEFIRNRYFHFYGYDLLLEKYDIAYRKWLAVVNEFSYEIFIFIINNFKIFDFHDKINERVEAFLRNYHVIDNKLKGIQQRVLIELRKINELIYYRSIFR